jgi:hypothetical protein
MRIRREHIKSAADWVAATVVAVAVVAPLGQFVISLWDEAGAYQHPRAKAAAVLAWFAVVTANSWFHWLGGGVIGFAIGAWLDAVMKRREVGGVSSSDADAEPVAIGDADYLPLPHAAADLYGRLGKCYVRDLVERVSLDQDTILNTIGKIISNYADVYGRRPPSVLLVKIDHDELKSMSMSGGARSVTTVRLGQAGESYARVVYTDLSVCNDDFRRASDAVMNVRHSSTLQIT